MIQESKLNQAIKQLRIKTNNSKADRSQLTKILFEILRFPLLKQANIHKYASRLGGMDLKRNKQQMQDQLRASVQKIHQIKVCQCCGLIQQEERIGYCQSLDEIDLCVGVRLYFLSITNHFIILVLGFLLYALFGLITNISASLKSEAITDSGICFIEKTCGFNTLSLGAKFYNANSIQQQQNQNQIFITVQLILGLLFVSLWGTFNFYRRHKENQIEVSMNIQRVSASNFTLMLENVPKRLLEKPQSEVIKNFSAMFEEYKQKTQSQLSYELVKINVARPMNNQPSQISANRKYLKQQLQKKQDLFRRLIKYRAQVKTFPVPLKVRQQAYQTYQNFYIEKYDQKQVHECPLQQKNLIFVTMRSSEARDQIVKLNKWNFKQLCSQGKRTFPNKIKISKAPQPEQIIWQRIGFQWYSKMFRVIIIYLISISLIGVSLGISIGVTYTQIQNGTSQALLISMIITVINLSLEQLIFMISYLENQKNKTKQQASVALKISIFQLINSIGIPLILVYIGKHDNTTQSRFEAVYSKQGLVSSIFYIGLFSLATPIGRIIDPFNILLKLKKWYLSTVDNRIKMHGQAELNQHYVCYQMDLGFQYAYIIKTVIFTAFFMPMQPIIAVFGPVGLTLIYAVNKYKLLYRFDRPRFHSFDVNNMLDWFFSFGPVALALGQLYAIVWAPQNSILLHHILAWVCLCFSLILYVVPTKIIYKYISQPELPNWDFYQKQPLIPSDYDLMNPYTREKAIGQLQHYWNKFLNKDTPKNYETYARFSFLSKPLQTKVSQKKSKLLFLNQFENQVQKLDSQDVLQAPYF